MEVRKSFTKFTGPEQLAGIRPGDLVDIPTLGRCSAVEIIDNSLLLVRTANRTQTGQDDERRADPLEAIMKILGTMNGWKAAPHCWWRYLLLPIDWQVTPAWTSVSIFGLVVFIDIGGRDGR